MNSEPTITPPHRPHLAGVLLGAGLGVALCAAVAWALGGTDASVEAAALAVAAGSVAMAWPAMLRRPMAPITWGLVAVGGSALRLVAIVAVAGAMDLALDVPREPFWLGVAAGAAGALAVETAIVLAVIGRLRPELAAAARGGAHA